MGDNALYFDSYLKYIFAGVMELVDVADSKSADGDIMWVRVPPPAPEKPVQKDGLFCCNYPLRSNKARGENHPLSRSPHACFGVLIIQYQGLSAYERE